MDIVGIREELQLFVRRFGLLSASCCEECCGEQVSLVQSHIIFEIRRIGAPSMQVVAQELGMDITTFSKQIKGLEKKGFVVRRMSPDDRRVTLLGLTDAGVLVLEKIDRFMRARLEKLFACMTPFEQEVTTRSFGLLNDALGQTQPDVPEKKKVAGCN